MSYDYTINNKTSLPLQFKEPGAKKVDKHTTKKVNNVVFDIFFAIGMSVLIGGLAIAGVGLATGNIPLFIAGAGALLVGQIWIKIMDVNHS